MTFNRSSYRAAKIPRTDPAPYLAARGETRKLAVPQLADLADPVAA